MKKPSRDDLIGFSYSEFKSILKKMGHSVPRDLTKQGFTTSYRNRYYRFRYWNEGEFLVDVSCRLIEFDRWANSVDKTISIYEFLGIDDVDSALLS